MAACMKFGMPIPWTIRTNVLKFQVNVTAGAAVSACAANCVWSKSGAFSTDPPDEHHARPVFFFLATKTEPFKLDARKRDFAAAARVLFVLAIIKNKVFCQVMLGFQRDVSSDINARFTLAITAIKTLASNIMEKPINPEPQVRLACGLL